MRLIPRAELARLAGVSKPAITKACDKGKLKPACHGDAIDLDHPAAQAYLAKQGKSSPPPGAGASAEPPAAAPPSPSKRGARATAAPPAAPPGPRKRGPGRPRSPTSDNPKPVGHMQPREGVIEGSDEDLQELNDLLYSLIDRYGTAFAFSAWLDALKNIELIREKRLKNGETEGGLISRELVTTYVFGFIEATNKKLLGDAAKTIASKVVNSVRAKGTLEEAQRLVREELSKQLKLLKATAARHLRKDDDPPSK